VLKYIQLSKEGKRESARYKEIPSNGTGERDRLSDKGYVDFLDNRVDPATAHASSWRFFE